MRRRRECKSCGRRVTTYEVVDDIGPHEGHMRGWFESTVIPDLVEAIDEWPEPMA